MLVEFKVAQFRSFQEPQTLSLVADAGKEHRESHCIATGLPGLPTLTRAALILGANASGKTNLVRALELVQGVVTTPPGERRERNKPQPFQLATPPRPSQFELTVIAEGVAYDYGFAATPARILREWLVAYPARKAQKWFERTWDPATHQEEWYFGPAFGGQKKNAQEATRSHGLFLAAAAQMGNEAVQPLYRWFSERLFIARREAVSAFHHTLAQCASDEGKERVLSFLREAGLLFTGVVVERRKSKVARFELGDGEIQHAISDEVIPRVLLSKPLPDGSGLFTLPLEEASAGAQRLFSLAGPWLTVRAGGGVLVVDDLEKSLHPGLAQTLLDRFHDPAIHHGQGQMLLTTREPLLLDAQRLRRDQIWFVNKTADGVSELYPLIDFNPKKGEDFQKPYLEGRFGALPGAARQKALPILEEEKAEPGS